MTHLTEAAIMDAFIKLLEENTLDHITVGDIIRECGVSRNTFYYHFGDIYALLKAVLKRDMDRLAEQRKPGESWEEVLQRVVDSNVARRRVFYHIYGSIEHDVLIQNLYEITEEVMMDRVREAAHGLPVGEEDLKLLCSAGQAMFLGLLLEWVRKGMREAELQALWKTERFFFRILPHVLQGLTEGEIS